MPKWTNIARLSEQQERAREAAFEAQMLALIAAPTDNPQPKPSPSHPAASPQADAIHITVTANGHTTHYPNLHTVPTHLRQHILNTWLATPTPISATTTPPTVDTRPRNLNVERRTSDVAPISPDPSSRQRPRTLRLAIALNLLLPGAGQIYLRRPLLGAAYAIPFLAILTAILTTFLRAYHTYLTLATNSDLLDPANLDTLAHAFPIATLTTLATIGTALFLASTLHLIIARPKRV